MATSSRSVDEIQQLVEQAIELGKELEVSARKMTNFAITSTADLNKLSGATEKEREEILRLFSELDKGRTKIKDLKSEYESMHTIAKLWLTTAQKAGAAQVAMSGPTAAYKMLDEQYKKLMQYYKLQQEIIEKQESAVAGAAQASRGGQGAYKTITSESLEKDLNALYEMSQRMDEAGYKAQALGDQLRNAMEAGGADSAGARAQLVNLVTELQNALNEYAQMEAKFANAEGQLVQEMGNIDEKLISPEMTQRLDAIVERMNTLKGALGSVQKQINAVTKTNPDLKAGTDDGTLARKNAQAQQELNTVFSEQNRILQENRAQLAEDQKYMKLQAQVANAAEGSVAQMTAQMKLLQMELSAINPNTEGAASAMEKLKSQINQLDLEIRKASPDTQKHIIDITEYGEATAFIASDIRKGIQALTQIQMQMQEQDLTTEEGRRKWQEYANAYSKAMDEVGRTKRNYNQIKTMTNALGSQAGALESAKNATMAMVSGVQVYTGLVSLAGGSTTEWGQALVKLQAIMAVVNGLERTYNSLLKSSTFLMGIQKGLAKSLSKAMLTLGTSSKWAGRAMQAAFKAGPLIILTAILALITYIVKGITQIANNWKTMAKIQASALTYRANNYKLLAEYETASLNRQKEMAEAMQQLTSIGGKYFQKAYEEEKDLLDLRQQAFETSLKLAKEQYPETGWYASATEDFREFTEQMILQGNALQGMEYEIGKVESKLQQAQLDKEIGLDTRIRVELENGRSRKMGIDDAIEYLQTKLDGMKKKYDIFLNLYTEQRGLFFERQEAERQRNQDDLNNQRLINEEMHKANEAELNNIQQRFNKERALAKERAQAAIDQLEWQKVLNADLDDAAKAQIDRQIAAQRTALGIELREINEQEQAANLAAIRKRVDVEYEALVESHEKRRNLLQLEHQRELEDIDIKLATDQSLTKKEQEELLKLREAYEQKYIKDKEILERELMQELIEAERSRYEVRSEAARQSSEEAYQYTKMALEKEMEAEILALQDLTEEERAQAATEFEIRLKYARAIALAELELRQTTAQETLTANLRHEKAFFNEKRRNIYETAQFERDQNIETLKVERESLAEELKMEIELIRMRLAAGDITEEQARAALEALQPLITTIDAIDKEINNLMTLPLDVDASNIWELLGFDKKRASAMKTFVDSILSDLQRVADAWVEYYEARTDKAEEALDAAKTEYEEQKQLQMEGYANSVETARREMLEKKKLRDQALREQREAERIQEDLNSAEAASDMIVAVAKVYRDFGMPLGAVMAGLMIASFVGSRIAAQRAAAAKARVETYGEGTVELLQGGSHGSGHDISLGYTKDGKERRAEGGEFFAVINKRSSRKYRSTIPDVINSLNDGSFGRKYQSIYDKTQGLLALAAPGNSVDLANLESGVNAIREQGEHKVYIDGQGNLIETYKGITRKTIRK